MLSLSNEPEICCQTQLQGIPRGGMREKQHQCGEGCLSHLCRRHLRALLAVMVLVLVRVRVLRVLRLHGRRLQGSLIRM